MSTVSSTSSEQTACKIELRDVYKVFGNRATEAVELLKQGLDKQAVQKQTDCIVGLAGVNACFPAQQISCVMGLSGSGKSTLVRHINRLIDPSAGQVWVDGQDILQLDMASLRQFRRYGISMVFQAFGLLPHLTVAENVGFGLEVRGDKPQQTRVQAQQWLERVGLQDYADNYPDELSGGMQQRVGLARALAVDADILLMDEAFSALDPLIRYEMQDELLRLQQSLKKTIVFITHDIDEALRLGQHIVVLREGRVEQSGTPTQIRDEPVNEYVARFVNKSV